MKQTIFMITVTLMAGMLGCKESNKESNPLLGEFTAIHQTPPFDKIKTEHYLPAVKVGIAEAKKEIDAIINNSEKPTFQNSVVALAESGEQLGKVLNIFYNINEAETSPEMQAVAKEISPIVTEHSNDISLNEQLFARIKEVYANRNELNLNAEETMLLEKSYKGFVRGGVNLAPEMRDKFREVNKDLSKLGLQFNENELAETNDFILHITDKKELAGLPESALEMAAMEAKEREKEGWVFTLQFPSYLPIIQFADNRSVREKMYRAFVSRCNKNNSHNNSDIVKQIVEKRLEKARMLGFDSYADYVLTERMAEDKDRVASFLDELFNAGHKTALNEKREVENYARQLGFKGTLQRWDWTYYSEKLRKEKYAIDDEMTKPYFELSKVRDGIFDLTTRLYGITYKQNTEIPVYHPDVKAYEVFDESGKLLSVLYLDFHPRQTKSSGAWMTSFREQSKKDGVDHRPFVSVVCNFTKPTETKPSLLTFNEVETFLHEFGHALHGMLSDVTYENLSGTAVYRDFVELPSQIMENWAIEKEWLDTFAVHYQTGEKIPQSLIEKLKSVANYQSGYMNDRQVSFATLDMAWHSIEEPLTTEVVTFNNLALDKFEIFPVVEGACMSTSFGHLFAGGYAAGYYGYKWAEVLDADAYSVFQKNGIFDKETAKRFRENIISKGGTEHPMKLYVDFRGQEPTIDALLKRSGLDK
ncbi:MAG: M3 family metallopeptidase [Salinivirgaceae bacterium]|nr:M3 family metallopeptidase [Salinivirgaceae bacterium]